MSEKLYFLMKVELQAKNPGFIEENKKPLL